MTRLELMKMTRTRKGMKLAGAHTCIGSAKLRDALRANAERRVYYGELSALDSQRLFALSLGEHNCQ